MIFTSGKINISLNIFTPFLFFFFFNTRYVQNAIICNCTELVWSQLKLRDTKNVANYLKFLKVNILMTVV